jgi:glycosyltransferase involved in cell wall biosynthesis
MDKGLVSVLIPVYNGINTIDRALKSLEFQTYTHWIAIIVDDGSTDGTRDLLTKYANNPKYKIIYHSENQGRGAARQTALENAEGQFIAFLDVDDFYHPDKLLLQTNTFIDNPSITIVGCSLMSFNNNNEFKVRGKGDGTILFLAPDKHVHFVAAASMIKLENAKRHKYNPKLNASEDIDFLEKVLMSKYYILLPNVLYYYEIEDKPDANKMHEYYKNDVIKQYSNLSFNQHNIISFLKSILKFIFIILLKTIGKLDIVTNRRGRKAPKEEIISYNITLEKLSK